MCLFKFDKEKYEDTLKREAKKEGNLELLANMIKEGIISLKQAAEKMNMTIPQFEIALKNLPLE
jgi:predicted HTH domain antitoxin